MRAISGSILVVEDDAVNRKIMMRALEKRGHSARAAKDGKQAIEFIQQDNFDLVLLDIVMPQMDGFAVLEYFKADSILRDLPVIVISALEDMESVIRCIELGADDYLPKPMNSVLMNARIDTSLEKKWLRERERARLLDEKRQTEVALFESEERLRTVVSSAPMILFSVDRQGILQLLVGEGIDSAGLDPEELVGQSVFEAFVENQPLEKLVRSALDGEWITGDSVWNDLIWETRVSPWIDADGVVDGALGVAIDVTQRKLAEEARNRLFYDLQKSHDHLRILSNRLVDVQETERRYMARELHDEIGQSLTGLKLALDLGTRAISESNPHLDEAVRLAKDVLGLVREMSLRLRPAMLDDLGLEPTLEWHFERFKLQTNINVSFSFQCDSERFPARVETALYRIIQEALTNIARHAQVSEVSVFIWQEAEGVKLEIVDQGVGFDVQAVLKAGESSGVAGMFDRVNLLDGEMKIDARPGEGATLQVFLPVDDKSQE